MQNVLAWVQSILSGEEYPITVRHLFYRLVGHDIIAKTESAYGLLAKHLAKWRRSGEVDYDAFADSTRWHIKPPTFDSMDDALVNCAETYRRDIWATQKIYLELWVEKDAVASILARAAEPFGVPVFVARGFASITSLHNAANTFRAYAEAGKRCIIYQFGDHDPSGVAAGESIKKAFADEFSVKVDFVRAAVTTEQIERLNLPTRPTKESNHARMKSWKGGESVELDAMPSAEISALVEACITQHIDQREWDVLKETESLERTTLKLFKEGLRR